MPTLILKKKISLNLERLPQFHMIRGNIRVLKSTLTLTYINIGSSIGALDVEEILTPEDTQTTIIS